MKRLKRFRRYKDRLLSIQKRNNPSSVYEREQAIRERMDGERQAEGSDTPEYEAFSYTWGDISDHKEIYVNYEPYNIGSNLESALRHLQYKDRPRVLWVDSICID